MTWVKWLGLYQHELSPYVIGADEVGVGSLAGPIAVCAVAVRKDWALNGLNDSKKLSEKKRHALCVQMHEQRVVHFITLVSAAEIDDKGIAKAIRHGFEESVKNTLIGNDPLLFSLILDGDVRIDPGVLHRSLSKPKADAHVPAVMAASVLAKTYRDNLMKQYANTYPGYGFEKHKGYPTEQHQEALKRLGPCSIHRRSYEPVKQLLTPEAVRARETP